jgi:hypothetical protein
MFQKKTSEITLEQAKFAEFLLEIDQKILPRKIGAGLNFKITLASLHINPDVKVFREIGQKGT